MIVQCGVAPMAANLTYPNPLRSEHAIQKKQC